MSFALPTPTDRTLERRLALGAAALAFASPVVAQPVAVVPAPEAPTDQIVIFGHYDRRGASGQRQKRIPVVGYGHLDLSLPGDRDILRSVSLSIPN